ncbi:hypothetical protein BBP40_011474 [Aspergillus hancockii]|nr:hypothetical protein BBP40_011474 [Aspergillus hancockii]
MSLAIEKDTTFLETKAPNPAQDNNYQVLSKTATYYSKPDLRPTKKWLAILNLVFAVAAKFAYLVPEHRLEDMDSPMVYFARARKLSFTDSQLIDHPNLQQVQIEGLTTFLCMAIGHINRCSCHAIPNPIMEGMRRGY